MTTRRFPPPWSVEELDACFVESRKAVTLSANANRQFLVYESVHSLLRTAHYLTLVLNNKFSRVILGPHFVTRLRSLWKSIKQNQRVTEGAQEKIVGSAPAPARPTVSDYGLNTLSWYLKESSGLLIASR